MKHQILLCQILNLFDIGCVEFARLFDPDLEKIQPKHLGAAISATLCQVVAEDLGLETSDVMDAYAKRLIMEEKGEI